MVDYDVGGGDKVDNRMEWWRLYSNQSLSPPITSPYKQGECELKGPCLH